MFAVFRVSASAMNLSIIKPRKGRKNLHMPGIPGNQRNYSLGTITKNTNSHCMATHNTENQGDGNIQKSYILFCQMKKIQIKCQITLYEIK